jgi:hypothetical protein
MTATATKPPPICIADARKQAGYASRDAAANNIPFAPETLGRHERGEVIPAPEDILVYADSYNAPWLLGQYCAACPIGRRTGKQATPMPLPQVVLNMHYWAAQLTVAVQMLECIALDGIIGPDERAEFDACMVTLGRVSGCIDSLNQCGGQTKTAASAS